jgi:NADH-quinone oxidoreductase subunit E
VSLAVIGLGPTQSVFIGGVIALVVGLILGLPGAAHPRPLPAVTAEPEPLRAVPAAAAAMPAAVMSAPVAPTLTPAPSPAPAAAPVNGARRPVALASARGGAADDLKKIKGVGPKLEELLHSLGFYHFDQIANWTAEEVAWVDDNLEGFKGRVTRDDWVAQARILATGGETEHSQRVERGLST